MRKRTTILALSAALIATMLLSVVQVAGQGGPILQDCKDLAFSTEEDFKPQDWDPPDPNPLVSDGDLLGIVQGPVGPECRVCARNADLLYNFDVRVDLGLDAADVINVERNLVAFSTELDDPNGKFTAGDLLVTNGVIIPNAALTYLFQVGYDIGLDAVHFVGDEVKIIELLVEWGGGGQVPPPDQFPDLLKEVGIDIWFSTEGTLGPLDNPAFLDGDLLSAASGTIVASNDILLPPGVPAGIPNDGVDFGLDAATTNRAGDRRGVHYSTEILFDDGDFYFTDGDVLKLGNGIAAKNAELIGCFDPKVKELGLDALSVHMPVTRTCESKITDIAGVDVADIGADGMAFTGTVGSPAIMAPVPFGGLIDIEGDICEDVQEFRVVYRLAGAPGNPWTGMDVLPPLDWRVADDALIPLGPDCDGETPWSSTVAGWYDGADYRYHSSAGSCNPGLALTVWDSAHVGLGLGGPDALYDVVLEVTTPMGLFSDTVRMVQLDNIPPEAHLEKTQGVCEAYDDTDMALTITAKISDTHFYRYRLSITGDGYPIHPYPVVAYYDDPVDNVIDVGTVNWDNYVGLHQVDVFDLAVDPVPCGYSVWLTAWERTLWCNFNFPNNQEYHYPGYRHDNDAWTFNYEGAAP